LAEAADREEQAMNDSYPVRFSVDYPARDLNRLTTGLRIFTVIPIAVVLGTISGCSLRRSPLRAAGIARHAASCATAMRSSTPDVEQSWPNR
jgi:hypothetical protein